MKDFLFTSRGRLNRARFWLGHIYLAIANAIVFSLFGAYDSAVDEPNSIIIALLAILCIVVVIASLYSAICLGIKRYHDRGKPGAWVLIQFVPAIGGLWYWIEAGCLRGESGPNAYGVDPLAARVVPA